MRVRRERLEEKEYRETLDVLYTAAGAVRGRAGMKQFLRDLLTESERIMLGRRIRIAQKISAGYSYEDIAEHLGVGYDTIARVHRWLRDDIPGYETALAGLRAELDRRGEKYLYGAMMRDPSVAGFIATMKKKYPLYFLLFPTPKKYRTKQKR